MSHFEVEKESIGVDVMSRLTTDRRDVGNYAMSQAPLSVRD